MKLGLALLLLLAGSARAATPPRYGGELRVLVPARALEPEALDPALARTPLDLLLARATCEPLASALAVPPRLDGQTLTLTLRPGLRFASGEPLHAADVVRSLERLGAGSPYAALLLPLASAGLKARSETELSAAFDFPYPDWPLALTHPATCPVRAGTGSGPFVNRARTLGPPAARLDANEACAAGRPFAETLSLRLANPRAAARALAAGEAELSFVRVPDPKPALGPLSVATYVVFNAAHPELRPVPALLEQTLDRAELVRIFVPPPVAPLYGLLAPSIEPEPVPARPARPASPLPARVSGAQLLVEANQAEQRAVADRLQVKLHDLGVDLKVVALPRAELSARMGRGAYDVALVSLPALPEAGLNLAQVLLLAGRADLARSELLGIGAIADPAARQARASARARALAPSLPIVPLFARGLGATLRPGVHGLRFDASGAPDLGQLWLEDARAP